MNHTIQPVPREVTQAKLDLRSQASARYRASMPYTLVDRLEEQAQRFAEQPLLVYGQERYSYQEANRRINQVAHAAYAQGCGAAMWWRWRWRTGRRSSSSGGG